ncbi:hypothetical protein [Alkaliphilus sp. B6464]|uniref:hypothetical protein n=1 Tax=Alkaliphilus sp. B6464 TaxID=2731219 RepID=UPI001BA72370|nr:hypothetical protein [Alkaliphilus sp. B6464]QUH22106.1 hypothetical protein HYG84_19560 [Alkaliphilus sp. B6464]
MKMNITKLNDIELGEITNSCDNGYKPVFGEVRGSEVKILLDQSLQSTSTKISIMSLNNKLKALESFKKSKHNV